MNRSSSYLCVNYGPLAKLSAPAEDISLGTSLMQPGLDDSAAEKLFLRNLLCYQRLANARASHRMCGLFEDILMLSRKPPGATHKSMADPLWSVYSRLTFTSHRFALPGILLPIATGERTIYPFSTASELVLS